MFLHNGNYIATNTFYDSDCKKDFVYVEGLTDGRYVMSDKPYLIQRDNGVLVSVDQSFDTLTFKDKYNHHLKTIELKFITNCSSQIDRSNDSVIESTFQNNNVQNALLLFALLTTIFLSFLVFRFLHNKN